MIEDTIIMVFGGGIMMMVGTYILMNSNLKNYFKKLRFKTELDQLKKLNNLEIRKLTKEAGLTTTKTAPSGELGGLQSLLPIFKNLSPEMQEDLIERFLGAPEGSGDALSGLLEIPAVQSFLQGLGNKEGVKDVSPEHTAQSQM